MAQKPKPKTEEKAKGLIGLKKGEKVKGAAYSVGNYKGKTLNLSQKELGKAGRKAASARGGKAVNIQNTRYDSTTKRVLGPKGNPLSGRVDLGGGNFAVYVNGRRVRANTSGKGNATGRGASSGSSGGGSGDSSTVNRGGGDGRIKKGALKKINGKWVQWNGNQWVTPSVETPATRVSSTSTTPTSSTSTGNRPASSVASAYGAAYQAKRKTERARPTPPSRSKTGKYWDPRLRAWVGKARPYKP